MSPGRISISVSVLDGVMVDRSGAAWSSGFNGIFGQYEYDQLSLPCDFPPSRMMKHSQTVVGQHQANNRRTFKALHLVVTPDHFAGLFDQILDRNSNWKLRSDRSVHAGLSLAGVQRDALLPIRSSFVCLSLSQSIRRSDSSFLISSLVSKIGNVSSKTGFKS